MALTGSAACEVSKICRVLELRAHFCEPAPESHSRATYYVRLDDMRPILASVSAATSPIPDSPRDDNARPA